MKAKMLSLSYHAQNTWQNIYTRVQSTYLAYVEDIGAHYVDVDAFDVLCLGQGIDVLNNVVDVFHETHFHQCLVSEIEFVSIFKTADEEFTKETHNANAHLEVDVFYTHLRIERQHRWHAPF